MVKHILWRTTYTQSQDKLVYTHTQSQDILAYTMDRLVNPYKTSIKVASTLQMMAAT